MGVQLNIKDVETVRMARDLADATGQSVTAVIRSALQHVLHQRAVTRAEKLRQLNAVVDDFQEDMPEDWRGKTSRELMDEIYDDGLPR